MEGSEEEEKDGKLMGWLEEARKGVEEEKGDGFACWQQIEESRFK